LTFTPTFIVVNPFLTFILVCLILIHSSFLSVKASSPSNEDYENGEELYDLACANCHGKSLRNPANASFNLSLFPKDEKDRFIESVTNGKGFMPALGEMFDSEELEQLWIYIKQHK
jgi:mono/diheme cytochrome c family protein